MCGCSLVVKHQLPKLRLRVRFPLSAPRRNGLCSVPIFLCRKISHTRRRSSSFAKRHARLACSLASALSGGSQSLSPFCDCACGANISTVWHCCVGTDFAPFRFFFAEKSVTRAVIPPLSQKGTLGSSVRLQARSLAAHSCYHLFAIAPAARIFQQFGIAVSEWTLLRSDFFIA